MSVISLRLSDSLHKAARNLAEKDDISLNQLIASALGEKLSALATEEMILERARNGDRAKFLAALDKSPDVPDPFEPLNEEPTMSEVLETQSPTVQQYCRKLLEEIVIDGVEAYGTRTQNGDLRFRVDHGIFAEIKFKRRTDEIDLRLYFPPDDVLDERYKLLDKTRMQSKYDRRLNAQEPIPDDVVLNIQRSREFMLAKHK